MTARHLQALLWLQLVTDSTLIINQHRRSLPSLIARQIEIELRAIERQVEPCGETWQGP
jgi:hypothetical protein